MKKFYKTVSVEEQENGQQVLLDSSPIKTPFQNVLFLPTEKLAKAVAKEWEKQENELDMQAMPLTNMAYTWQDKILPQREIIIDSLVPYLETEVICYFSTEPPELYEEQQKLWQPIADIFYKETGIKLNKTTDLLQAAQNDADMAKFREILSKMPALQLTAMQTVISLLGSAVLGYTLAIGYINADTTFKAGLVEETFQAEKWGLDPAIENKHTIIKGELENIDNFLALIS